MNQAANRLLVSRLQLRVRGQRRILEDSLEIAQVQLWQEVVSTANYCGFLLFDFAKHLRAMLAAPNHRRTSLGLRETGCHQPYMLQFAIRSEWYGCD